MKNYYTGIILDITKTNESTASYINVGQVATGPNGTSLAFANKIDANGNELWNKTFQRTPLTHAFRSVTNAVDNTDIIMCKSTKTDTFPASLANPADKGWLVRLDQNGNEIWNHKITPDPNFNSVDYLYRLVSLKDGSFIAVGSSNGIDSRGNNTQAGWVVKVNSKGCLFADCHDVGIKTTEAQKEELSIYPNPTKGIISVQRNTPFPKSTVVTVSDQLGRTVKELPTPTGKTKMDYDLSDLTPSVYILQINVDGATIQKKITILN